MIHFRKSPSSRHFITGASLQSRAFLSFINSLEKLPLFAHHPACKYHNHHLIWLGKYPLCLGCSMMTLGIIVGVFITPYLTFFKSFSFSVLLFLGIVLYLPAIGQIWIQQKAYKIVARFLLGLSIVLMFYAGLWLTPFSILGIILRLGFLATFFIVWKLTLQVRSEHSTSPCDHCPEGRFPICSYTTHRVPQLADIYFSHSDGTDPEADEFVKALQFTFTQNNKSN